MRLVSLRRTARLLPRVVELALLHDLLERPVPPAANEVISRMCAAFAS